MKVPFQKPAVRILLRTAAALIAAAGAFSCDPEEKPGSPSVGSNSNWLTACVGDDECRGELSCQCSACNLACSGDDDCAGLYGARCVLGDEAALSSECGAAPASGLCLPRCEPGQCDADRACVAGACVKSALPVGAFCEAASTAPVVARTRDEELLVLIQEWRTGGAAACAGGAALPAAPPLEWDARLVCTARVLAADVDRGAAIGIADSAGRGTQERMTLAGYASTFWGESYSLQAQSADEALAHVLGDTDSCQRLASPDYLSIGIGTVGAVTVVTIGAELAP